MPRETMLAAVLARVARAPFRLQGKRPLQSPQKALILQPCCLSQVMLATPLLAALSEGYPQARFDWAVSEWARPAIAGNPRIAEVINIDPLVGQHSLSHLWQTARQLQAEQYDTCFIPSRSGWLAVLAWLARIPQRVGLNLGGGGFAHTVAVQPSPDTIHTAQQYLSLLQECDLDAEPSPPLEFYPSDVDRTAVTARLVEEVNWLGEVPLVVIHPGGGENPIRPNRQKQWPIERFALLGNHLVREHEAKVIVVGAESDRSLGNAVTGIMTVSAVNWAGQLTLGELGALCEVADLYVGNDTGPTHIAVATGCPTLAIFGPTRPAISGPYTSTGRAKALWHDYTPPFFWEHGVTVEEAMAAADALLVVDES